MPCAFFLNGGAAVFFQSCRNGSKTGMNDGVFVPRISKIALCQVLVPID